MYLYIFLKVLVQKGDKISGGRLRMLRPVVTSILARPMRRGSVALSSPAYGVNTGTTKKQAGAEIRQTFFRDFLNNLSNKSINAMKVMGNTITGAHSGETTICSAEGFTISGKWTESF